MVVNGRSVSGPAEGRFDTLNVDNAGGSAEVVGHLASLGHRRIGMITGDPQNHDAHGRRAAYRRALEERGLEWRPEWEVRSDFTKSGGYAAAERLAGLKERPTAVFAANDSMAVGALSAFQEAGLRVPEDVAVVGFDDVPIARYVTPPLSTVHVDLGGLGRRAVELLLEALRNGGRSARHEVVPAGLVVRRSCGAAGPVAGVG